MKIAQHRFSKPYRLKSRKDIEQLFLTGKTLHAFPLKLVFLASNAEDTLPKLAISVPKKNIKSAVKRNIVKRRIKEAYRQNNTELKDWLQQNNKSCHIMVIYKSTEIALYPEIKEKIILLLHRLNEQLKINYE